MKTLIYFQLANFVGTSLPEELLGWFKIGNDVAPIVFQLQGEILFEYEFENKLNILDADSEYFKYVGQKKIPTNVVCYCKEFPSGGWSK